MMIRFWESHHHALYRLWFAGDEVSESFAQNQLQDISSTHNQRGREVCQIIERLTNIPTYYFLFNARDWSKQEDLDRLCPITGKDWRVSDIAQANTVAFRCDESRLVSELSTNCRDI